MSFFSSEFSSSNLSAALTLLRNGFAFAMGASKNGQLANELTSNINKTTATINSWLRVFGVNVSPIPEIHSTWSDYQTILMQVDGAEMALRDAMNAMYYGPFLRLRARIPIKNGQSYDQWVQEAMLDPENAEDAKSLRSVIRAYQLVLNLNPSAAAPTQDSLVPVPEPTPLLLARTTMSGLTRELQRERTLDEAKTKLKSVVTFLERCRPDRRIAYAGSLQTGGLLSKTISMLENTVRVRTSAGTDRIGPQLVAGDVDHVLITGNDEMQLSKGFAYRVCIGLYLPAALAAGQLITFKSITTGATLGSITLPAGAIGVFNAQFDLPTDASSVGAGQGAFSATTINGFGLTFRADVAAGTQNPLIMGILLIKTPMDFVDESAIVYYRWVGASAAIQTLPYAATWGTVYGSVYYANGQNSPAFDSHEYGVPIQADPDLSLSGQLWQLLDNDTSLEFFIKMMLILYASGFRPTFPMHDFYRTATAFGDYTADEAGGLQLFTDWRNLGLAYFFLGDGRAPTGSTNVATLFTNANVRLADSTIQAVHAHLRLLVQEALDAVNNREPTFISAVQQLLGEQISDP